MALDAAIGPPDYADYNDNSGFDTEDKVRQLLAGKLDPAGLDALCNLIRRTDTGPAQDRRRRRFGLAHDAALRRHVSTSLARRAQAEIADLTKRFPNLAGARVVG